METIVTICTGLKSNLDMYIVIKKCQTRSAEPVVKNWLDIHSVLNVKSQYSKFA